MANYSDKYKYFSVRLPNELYDDLYTIAKSYGMTGAEYVRNLISIEVDKFKGNPEAQKILASLFELQDKMKEVSSLFDSDKT